MKGAKATSSILPLYRTEMHRHLEMITTLLHLSKAQAEEELVFRHLHTMKGMTHALGLHDHQKLIEDIEHCFLLRDLRTMELQLDQFLKKVLIEIDQSSDRPDYELIDFVQSFQKQAHAYGVSVAITANCKIPSLLAPQIVNWFSCLLVNCFEHAFDQHENKLICIAGHSDQVQTTISISDNGMGFQAKPAQTSTSRGRGLPQLKSELEQFCGDLKFLSNTEGTTAELSFRHSLESDSSDQFSRSKIIDRM